VGEARLSSGRHAGMAPAKDGGGGDAASTAERCQHSKALNCKYTNNAACIALHHSFFIPAYHIHRLSAFGCRSLQTTQPSVLLSQAMNNERDKKPHNNCTTRTQLYNTHRSSTITSSPPAPSHTNSPAGTMSLPLLSPPYTTHTHTHTYTPSTFSGGTSPPSGPSSSSARDARRSNAS
jgi:hypothetical protein